MAGSSKWSVAVAPLTSTASSSSAMLAAEHTSPVGTTCLPVAELCTHETVGHAYGRRVRQQHTRRKS